MGRFAYSWELMKASWNVLRQDKELLVFPLLSGICCLLVIASFAVPVIMSGNAQLPNHDMTQAQRIAYWAVLFCFYFANYFVVTFFNTAIVACAISRSGRVLLHFWVAQATAIGWRVTTTNEQPGNRAWRKRVLIRRSSGG